VPGPARLSRATGKAHREHGDELPRRDLANLFHTYYNAEVFLVGETPLRNARLALILAVQQVLRNGLTLLGVSAPQSM
jgi:arginyl-tRNA synthetase